MIEHTAWWGDNYATGFDGQRVAIVGYSHWLGDGDEDTDRTTLKVVECVINGCYRIAFFSQIRNYFGYTDHRHFWSRVLFFNFLPSSVGMADQRFHSGTHDQNRLGQARFLRLLDARLPPHKVLVFSTKGWSSLPPTREEQAGANLPVIGAEFPHFTWGTYDVAGQSVMAFGLCHPQGARGPLMRAAVQHILALPQL